MSNNLSHLSQSTQHVSLTSAAITISIEDEKKSVNPHNPHTMSTDATIRNENVTMRNGMGTGEKSSMMMTTSSSSSLLLQQQQPLHLITSYKEKTIHQAAQDGDLPTVSLILSWNLSSTLMNGKETNMENSIHGIGDPERHATVLHWSAYHGHDELVNLLLNCGSDPLYVPSSMPEGQNALSWCVIAGKLNIVLLILNHIARLQNERLIHLLCSDQYVDNNKCSIYFLACQNCHLNIFQYLIHLYFRQYKYEKNRYPTVDTDNNVATDANDDIQLDIIDHLNGTLTRLFLDAESHTLLHWSVYNGDYNFTKFLLYHCLLHNLQYVFLDLSTVKNSTNNTNRIKKIWDYVRMTDSTTGRTVFHWAAKRGHLHVLELLIAFILTHLQLNDNDLTIKNELNYELYERTDSDHFTAMEYAIHNSSIHIVKYLNALKLKLWTHKDESAMESMQSKENDKETANTVEELSDDEDIDDLEKGPLNLHEENKNLNYAYVSSMPLSRMSCEEVPNLLSLRLNNYKVSIRLASIIFVIFASSAVLNLLHVPLALLLMVAYGPLLFLFIHPRSKMDFVQSRDGFLLGCCLGVAFCVSINYWTLLYPILLRRLDDMNTIGTIGYSAWFFWRYIMLTFSINIWLVVLLSTGLITYFRLVFLKTNPGFLNNCISVTTRIQDQRTGKVKELKEERMLLWSIVEEEILKYYEKGVDTLPKRYCKTCQVYKTLRSKHDVVTNRCISRFDHYCSWIQMPVGRNNHLEFLVFVCSSELFILSSLFLSCVALFLGIQQWDTPGILYSIFYGPYAIPIGVLYSNFLLLLLCVPIGLLMLASIRNAMFKLTTNELKNAHRYPWLIPLKLVYIDSSSNGFILKRMFGQMFTTLRVFLRSGIFNVMDDGIINNLKSIVWYNEKDNNPNTNGEYGYNVKPWAMEYLKSQRIRCPYYVDLVDGAQYSNTF